MKTKSSMIIATTEDEVRDSLKPEPAKVYQDAAPNLRYKRITAMATTKPERAMSLLQLGLGHKSSPAQGWDSFREKRMKLWQSRR